MTAGIHADTLRPAHCQPQPGLPCLFRLGHTEEGQAPVLLPLPHTSSLWLDADDTDAALALAEDWALQLLLQAPASHLEVYVHDSGLAQQDRDDAWAQLQLLRVRSAHLLDQAPAVRAELDSLLAHPGAQEPGRLLPEIRQELDLLPKLLDKLAGLQQAGLPAADRAALLPPGLFQVSVALKSLDTLLRRVPAQGVGRFVKIGAGGEKLPAFAAQWVAVLDTAAGLMWEVKTEGELHSRHTKYTNHGKDQAGDSGWLVKQCNQQRFAGHADWRLPTKDELVGLAQAKDRREWSPNDEDFHWSSSAAAGEFAWDVNLYDGGALDDDYRSGQYAVRVVRAGQ